MDIDDISSCPNGPCASCGTAVDVAVATFQTPVGVYCQPLCAACVEHPPRPASWSVAVLLVGGHCEHLGIDVDQMGAALETERATC